jgi:hypothetical protein
MKKDVYLEALMLGHVLGEADGLITGAKAAVAVGRALLKCQNVMVPVSAGLVAGFLLNQAR